MPKRTRASLSDEFPLLKSMGLQACSISADGNCLFNALSDQIHGDESMHAELRAGAIQYVRQNIKEFEAFLPIGGELRRSRRGAGSPPVYSGKPSKFSFAGATEAEIKKAMEDHLTKMAKGKEWGGNVEIVAFAQAFNTDVRVYQEDQAFWIRASEDGAERPVAHIAYHKHWEHYSSIRNLDGPMTGLPQVRGGLEGSAIIGSSTVEEASRPAKKRRVSSVPEETKDLEEAAGHPGNQSPEAQPNSGTVKVKVKVEDDAGLALPAPVRKIKIKLTVRRAEESTDGDFVTPSVDEVYSDFILTTLSRPTKKKKKKSKARQKGKRTLKSTKSASMGRTTRAASAPL